MKNDDFGDRMKRYEMDEAGRRMMPLLPIVARLDGKCFSKYTSKLKRPYDERLSGVMRYVTRKLVEETNAIAGYTQSDEITLAWYSDDSKSQVWFDGRIQKMCSVLASMCTAYFNAFVRTRIAEKALDVPGALFDCRVWDMPNLTEASNVFLWREQDATKNAISMAARSYYSAKALHAKSGAEMQEMLFQKGVNFNDYPAFFKRGTFVLRRRVSRPFTVEEMKLLPPKHEARKNPNLVVERSEVYEADMPKFSSVTNRQDVLFFGAKPVTKKC